MCVNSLLDLGAAVRNRLLEGSVSEVWRCTERILNDEEPYIVAYDRLVPEHKTAAHITALCQPRVMIISLWTFQHQPTPCFKLCLRVHHRVAIASGHSE